MPEIVINLLIHVLISMLHITGLTWTKNSDSWTISLVLRISITFLTHRKRRCMSQKDKEVPKYRTMMAKVSGFANWRKKWTSCKSKSWRIGKIKKKNRWKSWKMQWTISLNHQLLKKEIEVQAVEETAHGDARGVIHLQLMSLTEDHLYMIHITNNGHTHMRSFTMSPLTIQFPIIVSQSLLISLHLRNLWDPKLKHKPSSKHMTWMFSPMLWQTIKCKLIKLCCHLPHEGTQKNRPLECYNEFLDVSLCTKECLSIEIWMVYYMQGNIKSTDKRVLLK